jgi:hypothetical protein
LNPTTPALSIDKSFVKKAIPASTSGPNGEVWFATTIKGGRVFAYVFVSDLSEDWDMIPSDLALNDEITYRAFESSTPSDVFLFSKDSPLHLKVCPFLAPLSHSHHRIVTKMSLLCGQLFQSRRVASLCLGK